MTVAEIKKFFESVSAFEHKLGLAIMEHIEEVPYEWKWTGKYFGAEGDTIMIELRKNWTFMQTEWTSVPMSIMEKQ